MTSHSIVVLGGRSLVTPYLVEHLASANLTAEVFSENHISMPAGFRLMPVAIISNKTWQAPKKALVISLLPLSELIPHLKNLVNVQSIIALGSTSRFSKANSKNLKERINAENMEIAENIFRSFCTKNGIIFTILRSTLIYDGKNDQSIARIARIACKSGVFPVAAPATGLRQPIHADDVAKAIMGALGNSSVYFKTLNIAGGEVLTYRDMVSKIFSSMGMRPRLLMLPAGLIHLVVGILSALGLIGKDLHVAEIFRRMNDNLVYDIDEGLKLLDYKPRRFEPELKVS